MAASQRYEVDRRRILRQLSPPGHSLDIRRFHARPADGPRVLLDPTGRHGRLPLRYGPWPNPHQDHHGRDNCTNPCVRVRRVIRIDKSVYLWHICYGFCRGWWFERRRSVILL